MKYSNIKSTLLISTALFMGACQTMQTYEIQTSKSDNWEVAEAQVTNGKLYNMGRSYLALSDYGLAIEAFRRDIRVNGSNPKSLNGLGIAYDMLGRFDLSQKYYQQALALEPELPVTYSNLAYSQYKQGAYENAIHLAEAAKELLDVNIQEETTPTMIAVAQSNQSLAAVTALEKIKDTQEEIFVAEGYVIERTTERNWEMVKPKPKAQSKILEKYKSNIAIAKILKRKSEIKAEIERTKDINQQQSSIESQIKAVHEEIELAVALEIILPVPSHKPQIPEANQLGTKLANIPVPQNKPDISNVVVSSEKSGFFSRIRDALSSILGKKINQEVVKEKIVWFDNPTYKVSNGTGRPKMARRFSGYLACRGLEVPSIGDSWHFGHKRSIIEFASGNKERAEKLASILPVNVELKESELLNTRVKLTVGKDLLELDDSIQYTSKEI